MYIPKYYRENTQSKLLSFIRQYNFGIIVSTKNNLPLATHLPFVIEEHGEKIKLISHMAFANEQWRYFDDREILVIFTEPHAYISPRFYEKKENVPTWNFVAVHCYGVPKFVEGNEAVLNLLEKTIKTFEKEYFGQWQQLSDEYKLRMIKGIKAFEIIANKIQGKYKLSQNKTAGEQQNIISAFENSKDDNIKDIAKLMRENRK